MKVLLLKDVYKLGHAGDVKKVADGYGRNYLIPQKLAVLATPGTLKQAEQIRISAATQRAQLNQEMSGVAEQIAKLTLTFSARAGETGKLYGSITPQMISDVITEKTGTTITRRNLDSEPIRTLGEHTIHVRLTMDLIPEVKVIVYREGEVLAQAVGGAAKPLAAEKPAPLITVEPETAAEETPAPSIADEPEAAAEETPAPSIADEPEAVAEPEASDEAGSAIEAEASPEAEA